MLTSPRRWNGEGGGKRSGLGMYLLWHAASALLGKLHTRRELVDSPLSVALFVLAHLRPESPCNHILQSKWYTHFTFTRDIQFPGYFKIYVNLVLKAVENPGRSRSRRIVNKCSGSGLSHKDRQIIQDSCFNTHFPTASLLAPMYWLGGGVGKSWFNDLSQIRS